MYKPTWQEDKWDESNPLRIYRVQFTMPNPDHLTRTWLRVQATTPINAALNVLRRNHVLLARCIGKTMVAHVASPGSPVHPNGMPMVTNGYTLEFGKEATHA